MLFKCANWNCKFLIDEYIFLLFIGANNHTRSLFVKQRIKKSLILHSLLHIAVYFPSVYIHIRKLFTPSLCEKSIWLLTGGLRSCFVSPPPSAESWIQSKAKKKHSLTPPPALFSFTEARWSENKINSASINKIAHFYQSASHAANGVEFSEQCEMGLLQFWRRLAASTGRTMWRRWWRPSRTEGATGGRLIISNSSCLQVS